MTFNGTEHPKIIAPTQYWKQDIRDQEHRGMLSHHCGFEHRAVRGPARNMESDAAGQGGVLPLDALLEHLNDQSGSSPGSSLWRRLQIGRGGRRFYDGEQFDVERQVLIGGLFAGFMRGEGEAPGNPDPSLFAD